MPNGILTLKGRKPCDFPDSCPARGQIAIYGELAAPGSGVDHPLRERLPMFFSSWHQCLKRTRQAPATTPSSGIPATAATSWTDRAAKTRWYSTAPTRHDDDAPHFDGDRRIRADRTALTTVNSRAGTPTGAVAFL